MRGLAGSLVLVAVSSLFGCSGGTETEQDAVSGQGAATTDPRKILVKTVARVEILGGPEITVIGAPEKIDDVLSDAMAGSIKAIPPGQRTFCGTIGGGPAPFDLKMLDRSGKVLARAELCMSAGVSGGRFHSDQARVTTGGGVYMVPLSDKKLTEITERGEAVGDVINAITKVVASDGKVATSEDEIDSLLERLDLNQVPEVRSGVPKCMPSATFKYFRGDEEVAELRVFCAASPGARKQDAMLVAGGKQSWVTYKP